MFDTELVPSKDSPSAFLRRVLPTLASFATGSTLGVFFRQDLLGFLVDPWVNPNMILEGHPSSEDVSVWFSLISAAVGLVLALPWLTFLAWGLVVRRSRPTDAPSAYTFIFSSYAAIGIGLCLAAFAVFPAFLLRQRETWHGIGPVPWAYVELELHWIVGVAVAFQMCAVLFVFAGLRLFKRPHFGAGA